MTLLAAARMVAYLNALGAGRVSAEVAAEAVAEGDVAHHVVDPDGVAGLDPLRATPLRAALATLADREPELWVLALPAPGRLGVLRGPRELNLSALEAGSAVVAAGGGTALVPYAVGPSVQWRVFAAERPATPASPYDAERTLSEAVLASAATLARLDVAHGSRPEEKIGVRLPGTAGARRQALADRATRLLQACDVALDDHAATITSYESDVRERELRTVRAAAVEALSSAATWSR